ncbi:2-amino-4-hydroxy-6-hydroxymethyldihydropteridine diphosphokinase [Montanilutibacter psychrotolerans]|uniref:2-amino-4-hydroxy-6-hydroxymethyldihydropteridine pyrophosphokinase n=1 Tax=Montanilutibacter psychrotolerans TaxID=1327343 RepID=A0A3M8SWE6_9GAMM|nr:2-amino-4-hydroxy-6-hydroxymethyldihydropteridine diphosphokinase [Lysobacter psychrotolerans]RNF85143.1 2-amino-4-hydroxy-6-hydroxymethyldihydropteridine diphosphokinase [Lysobacter psychrotolerans]
MNPPVIAYIGLGANLGEAAQTVQAAFAALGRLAGCRLLAASRLYRTPAWGMTEQPDFINAVAQIETTLAPEVLLDRLLQVEREAGRERRSDGGDRWGPRTLDLDLLLYAERIIDVPGLRVPHPHLHERAFALLPLVEIAPDIAIPGVGSARDALATMAMGDIEALPYASPPAET